MRVYVASSFRNERQPVLVELLRSAGHEVYDFHHPEVEGPGAPPDAGHGWEQAHPAGQPWTAEQYLEALRHPLAVEGFNADWDAMVWADVFVLVLPCGSNAHLEAGYAVGAGKPLAVYLDPGNVEPELMHKVAGLITDDSQVILTWLADRCSETAIPDDSTLLEEPLTALGLPRRCHLALCRGIKRGPTPTLGELLSHDVTEVRNFWGVGPGCLDRLAAELDRRDLHLRPGAE